ncbi:MAG TPA: patatin-like phospholipase family protein [Burkholderiales bacterium]|jgi:NTE family protein|nr:patatin-like phospholipase family protein [Burkholderiales bacterium]
MRLKKTINVALQGGGSHGAFAWGVLDRLLEEPGIGIEGVVGTSSGAMNAAVAAYGLTIGGNDGARAKLAEFWCAISEAAQPYLLQPSWLDRSRNLGSLDHSPGYLFMDMLSRFFSPYELNPMNHNPLRDVLSKVIDFDALRASSKVKLFTCAANVLTGRLRVFERHEQSADTVLASACLPSMFQAVEVNGEHYWDGGYMGNPPIFPLIYNCESRDVVLVMINPIEIDKVPTGARAIMDRINTLSFNSSLMREMRAINFVSRLVDDGYDDAGRLKKMLIHCIDAEDQMRALGASSKLNTTWEFLMYLHELGRARGEAFLNAHYDKLGRESATPIAQRFL